MFGILHLLRNKLWSELKYFYSMKKKTNGIVLMSEKINTMEQKLVTAAVVLIRKCESPARHVF